jgi:hypothetical protein
MPFFKLKHWLIAGMLLPLALVAMALIAPAGPDYSVVERGDGFELRRYAPFNVAETMVPGAAFTAADIGAYPVLLDYIRGRNSSGRKVPMMAPVMQQPSMADGEPAWRVQFVMPKEYPLGMLPAPAEGVALAPQPERLMAALRFGGGWQEARWYEKAAELRDAIARAGRVSIGEPVFARYNAAFVPGLLRRNEVLVAVEP